MILYDVHIAGQQELHHLQIERKKIKSITTNRHDYAKIKGDTIQLNNATAYPGFINSHDHLDFNLFPALGNRIYENYTQWGKDIHDSNEQEIKAIVDIPLALRVQWGIYKNLLNGFTTVINHGEKLATQDDLISIFQDYYFLHSPSFEKNWRRQLNNPLSRNRPYVMHIGEGTDEFTVNEVDTVIRNNFLKKRIVAVHGVAMTSSQADSFTGLIWCPASNFFMLGQTANVDQLTNHTSVVFGTDSTLTAPWNAWEHFRTAVQSGMINKEMLLTMLTTTPANLWKFTDRGSIQPGMMADIVVLREGTDFFTRNPEDILLVIHNGNIRLFDETLSSQLKSISLENYSRLEIGSSVKMIQGDIPGLVREIRKYCRSIQFPDILNC